MQGFKKSCNFGREKETIVRATPLRHRATDRLRSNKINKNTPFSEAVHRNNTVKMEY